MASVGGQVVTSIVSMAVAGVFGFLVARVKNISKLEKARIEIEKCLARQMIFDAYEKYVIRGEKLSISRYDELLRIFDAYTALGGNGTAKKYMEEIRKLRPYLVID